MNKRPVSNSSAGSSSAGNSSGAESSQAPPVRTPRNRGVGMLIITAYGVFAVSATARALYQIIVHFQDSPIAYTLSGFAAAVYVVATLALARTSARAWVLALCAVLVEMAGVLGIGLWTVLEPDLFAESTVWSHFGQGYGYVPLVLPFLGLFWLLKHRPGRNLRE